MFKAVKETYQKSIAAVVVQKVLEQQQANWLFNGDADALSTQLIADLWSGDPSLINGDRGPKPHKISVAALAFANGMKNYPRWGHEHNACHTGVGMILLEMERNGYSYALNSKDLACLETARRAYDEHDAIGR